VRSFSIEVFGNKAGIRFLLYAFSRTSDFRQSRQVWYRFL